MIQGPLGLDFARRGGGWPVPSIENGALTTLFPPTMHRLRLWRRAAITVDHRPDWIFIKPHCHGMDPRDEAAMPGSPLRRVLGDPTEWAAASSRHPVDFGTAR